MLEPRRGRVALGGVWGARLLEHIECQRLGAQREHLAASLAGQGQQRHLPRRNRCLRALGGESEHIDVEARGARQVRRDQAEAGDGV